MHGIYAVVMCCDQGGMVEVSWYYRTSDHYSIYDKVMELTGNDHEISDEAASWCELACVGKVYEFHEGKIEIVDFD